MSEDQNAPTGATISASDLRRLAETADGLRNRDLALVRRGGHVTLIDAAERVATDDHLLTLRTDDQTNPAQRPNFDITLQVLNGPSLALRGTYDAAFWSESAIDKFVIPYYAGHVPTELLQRFRQRLGEDAALILVPHPPLSRVRVLRLTSDGIQDLSIEDYLAL